MKISKSQEKYERTVSISYLFFIASLWAGTCFYPDPVHSTYLSRGKADLDRCSLVFHPLGGFHLYGKNDLIRNLLWVIVHSEDRARVRPRPGIQVMQKVK
jgi:hypothetical protein